MANLSFPPTLGKDVPSVIDEHAGTLDGLEDVVDTSRYVYSSMDQRPNYPDLSNSKTLLISSRRSRSFLERTARELLAGGTEYLVLSALGEAIPLCIQLDTALQAKNLATRVLLETIYHSTSKNLSNGTAGLRIIVKKHEKFKGCRISPGFVNFAAELPEGEMTGPFDSQSTESMGSVIIGNCTLQIGSSSMHEGFTRLLSDAGHDITCYGTLHKALLEAAMEENAGKDAANTRSSTIPNVSTITPHIRLAFCRPYNISNRSDRNFSVGSVFISVFKDNFPLANPCNMGLVYVVSPQGANYGTADEFLTAVHCAAANLMTALCDLNGYVKRERSKEDLNQERIAICRVPLLSGGEYMHAMVHKTDVAKAIIEGLAEAYRHGPSPRLNFTFDDNVFAEVWFSITGR